MKLVSQHTVKLKGVYHKPGSEIEVDDETGKSLLESGAAARRMREVADDEEDESKDGRASGANTAPNPAQVGRPAGGQSAATRR